jgi:cullin-4
LESFPDPIAATSLLTFYKLLTRLGEPPVQRLRKSFSVWIKATGARMVEKANGGEEEEAKRDAGMVERLIEFKTKLDRIVVGCFAEDREMFFAIKEAFETFINQRRNKPAELIAKYLDLKMRTASRSMNEAEIDTCLDHVLVLFRYSQAKDIFEEFYKRDLAKRLLLSRSSSIDLERNMVMKLKKGMFEPKRITNLSCFQELIIFIMDNKQKKNVDQGLRPS